MMSNETILPSDTIPEILTKLCSSKDRELFVNYSVFKLIASASTYEMILLHVMNVIKQTTKIHHTADVHLNMKGLTISDLDKHKPFILDTINKLNNELPDTLNICYCYKTPFVFSQIYNLLFCVIDKETRQKIKIVKNE